MVLDWFFSQKKIRYETTFSKTPSEHNVYCFQQIIFLFSWRFCHFDFRQSSVYHSFHDDFFSLNETFTWEVENRFNSEFLGKRRALVTPLNVNSTRTVSNMTQEKDAVTIDHLSTPAHVQTNTASDRSTLIITNRTDGKSFIEQIVTSCTVG